MTETQTMASETMQAHTSVTKAPLAGELCGRVHSFPVRVYYEDTDAGGVVYYANYLKFAERARTEMMRLVDAGYDDRVCKDGIAFAVRRCEVDYRAPARLGDLLEVRTRIMETKRASLSADQVIRRNGEDLVRMHVSLVCIDREGRPARIPGILRDALQSLSQS